MKGHPYEEDHKELAAFLRVLADHVETMEGTPIIDFLCFYHLSGDVGCGTEVVGFSLNGPDCHLVERIRDFVSVVDDDELRAFFKKGHANYLGPSEWFQRKYMSRGS